jgi:hypothetical protein
MHKHVLAFAYAFLIALPAGAADPTDVLSAAHRWVDGFNNADATSVMATCADQAAKVDDFPPHEWHGAKACTRWFEDFASMSKAEGITNSRIKIEAALHTELNTKFAYVVFPEKTGLRPERRADCGPRHAHNNSAQKAIRLAHNGVGVDGSVIPDSKPSGPFNLGYVRREPHRPPIVHVGSRETS